MRLVTCQYPQHVTIDHTRGDYVVGAVHTNTIESFWSIFKRGVIGTFHNVSKKYLPLYVAEFEGRYNISKTFSAFFACAALVKLKLPVMTFRRPITTALLCAITMASSISTLRRRF